MNLPTKVKDKATQRALDYLSVRVPVIAAGFVTGGGGSVYTLTHGFRVSTVAGGGTGLCRVTCVDKAKNIVPIAIVRDNGAFFCTVVNVTESPMAFDVYQWSNGAILTNRSFYFVCFGY